MLRRQSSSRSNSIEITPLGDSALIVRIGRAVEGVLDAAYRIEKAKISGVIELVPAYSTVGVFFDVTKIVESGAEPEAVAEWLGPKIREALSSRVRRAKTAAGTIEVPVCFDAEFAIDLGEVAARAGMVESEVVDLYCAADYEVACIGFTPGFPYLTGLPKQLATPRRSIPRTEIAAGAVAIGGEQTGIYPLISPGGWNVIGRTALRLFDAATDPPALLRPGDRVRFRAITRDEFERSIRLRAATARQAS